MKGIIGRKNTTPKLSILFIYRYWCMFIFMCFPFCSFHGLLL